MVNGDVFRSLETESMLGFMVVDFNVGPLLGCQTHGRELLLFLVVFIHAKLFKDLLLKVIFPMDIEGHVFSRIEILFSVVCYTLLEDS